MRAGTATILCLLAAACARHAEPPWPQRGAADAPQGPPPVPTGLSGPDDYDLASPSAAFDLPPELTEISALTGLADAVVGCVQDELGALFQVDVRSGRVVARQRFGPDGDWEGLTRTGNDLWVLRSDGLLAHVQARGGELAVVRHFELATGHGDHEGLCYDRFARVLLVVPKDRPEGDKEARRQRHVFAVDPETGALRAEPALTLSLDAIGEEAAALGLELPHKRTARGKKRLDIALRFSEIAVHPVTGCYHLLSGVDGMLLVLDRQGRLRHLHFFDGDGFDQPEGVTFLADGSMVVASEGRDAPASLRVFRYRPAMPPKAPSGAPDGSGR